MGERLFYGMIRAPHGGGSRGKKVVPMHQVDEQTFHIIADIMKIKDEPDDLVHLKEWMQQIGSQKALEAIIRLYTTYSMDDGSAW